MREKILKLWPFLLTVVLTVAVWGILTVRAAVPLVSSFSPVDGSNFVASSSDFIINFNQSVFAGAGFVYIKKVDDDSIAAAIPAASTSLVLISGSQATINPPANLDRDEFYYITVDANAFRNSGIEYYSGFSNETTWNFHTINDLFIYEKLENIETHGNGVYEDYLYLKSIAVGNIIYFIAGDGTELWKSDGTPDGTVLVKTVCSVDMSGWPGNFVEMGGIVYFVVYDMAGSGSEIWRTDGTESGTYVLKDIVPGSGGSEPNYLTVFNGYLYFSAYTAADGAELWRSDGTEGGTALFKSIRSGSGNSRPSDLIVSGSRLFFSASDSTNNDELWATDGTSGGTAMVKDIYSGSFGSGIKYPVSHNGILYFRANSSGKGYEPWRSDGTLGGTYLLKDIRSGSNGSLPSNFISCGENLYFFADDGTTGGELFKSNGTSTGTTLVKNINPSGSSAIGGPICASGTLYFYATDGVHGSEVWRSDGTTSGTVMIKDVDPGSVDTANGLIYYDGLVYYSIDDGVHGRELWRTDGTASGTEIFFDAYPGAVSGASSLLPKVFGSQLFFLADSGSGLEPWATDGTVLGTEMLKDTNLTNSGSDPKNFFKIGGKIVFTAETVAQGRELWVVDESGFGAAILKDINPGPVSGLSDCSGGDSGFAKMGEILYFSACDPNYGNELWRTDGTSAGTYLVKDINPSAGSGLMNLTVSGDRIYFSANDGTNGSELWATDGTPEGTNMVKNIHPAGSSYPNSFSAAGGGSVFFLGTDGVNGGGPWFSDGTPGGTIYVADITVYGTFYYYNNLTYFGGDDGVNGVELWRTDGTPGGTLMVDEINPTGDSNPDYFFEANGKLCFSATETDFGDYELYCSDGTPGGAAPVSPANGNAYIVLHHITSFYQKGSSSIFFCNLGTCSTDGTPGGTFSLAPVDKNNFSPRVYGFAYEGLGDYVYGIGARYLGSSNIENESLWRFADTASKTVPMINDYSFVGDNYTTMTTGNLLESGGRLYFPFYEADNGLEPYVAYYISLPAVSTGATSSVTKNSAVINGMLDDNGLAGGIERGFIFGTSSGLTIADIKYGDAGSYDVGPYSSAISSLTCGSTYYYRAYAKNKAGLVYGEEKSFATLACACPSIDNASAYNAYPACGASACVSGYHLSGTSCAIDSSWSSGGPGGGGVPVLRQNVFATSSPAQAATGLIPEAPLSNSGPFSSNAPAGKWGSAGYNQEKEICDLTDPDIDCHDAVLPPELVEKRKEEAVTMKQAIVALVQEQAAKVEGFVQKIKRQFLENKLSGRILLQVESKGEAWYVNPDDNKRYYLGRPIDMWNIMREFGLGATHEYITETTIFPKRLWGKILLDVEDKGRAYYINPIDRKKYYLACPTHAFRVVRLLGLGINEKNIDLILAGEN